MKIYAKFFWNYANTKNEIFYRKAKNWLADRVTTFLYCSKIDNRKSEQMKQEILEQLLKL